MTQASLSYCAAEVQRHDRPQFLTALFAPSCLRDDLFALYAFNLEIAKTLESVSEKMLGQIRLQWWRETIDGIYHGKVRKHAVAEALAPAITRHDLPREEFDRLIDARERDLEDEPPANLAALAAYADASAGSLVALAARMLAPGGADATARSIGTVQALAGLLTALPFRLLLGRVDLPGDRLVQAGLSLTALREGRGGKPMAEIVGEVAALATEILAVTRADRATVPRAALPALLVGKIAERQLARLAASGNDPFSPGLRRPDPLLPVALTWSAWRGRY